MFSKSAEPPPLTVGCKVPIRDGQKSLYPTISSNFSHIQFFAFLRELSHSDAKNLKTFLGQKVVKLFYPSRDVIMELWPQPC